MEFVQFKTDVATQFATMAAAPLLFTSGVDKGALWADYLGIIDPNGQPIYRTKSEHDCNACRHFIKQAGNIILIDSDVPVQTIWDIAAVRPGKYQAAARALRDTVRRGAIDSLQDHRKSDRCQFQLRPRTDQTRPLVCERAEASHDPQGHS